MNGDDQQRLPAVREITVSESAHRELERRSGERDELAQRVQSLSAQLAHMRTEIDSANHLLDAIVTALDDLARAASAARSSNQLGAIVDGVDLVRRELTAALARAEIVEMAVQPGDIFDDSRHQLIAGMPQALALPGIVIAILRSGWERRGAVVRPALVEVDWRGHTA